MARLPTPGADENSWGNILNDYLAQAHNTDGSLKPAAVQSAVPDASASQAGMVQLDGDLGGTSSSPLVVGIQGRPVSTGAPANDDVLVFNATSDQWEPQTATGASSATTLSEGVVQLAGDLGGTSALPTVPGLATKADDNAVVHLTGNQTIAGTKTFSAAPAVPDGSFTQAKIQNLVTDLTGKQPVDGDLTAIAGLSAPDNDILQRKSGAWINRTPAQLKTDLGLVGGDVGFTAGGAISATDVQTAIRQVSAGAERSIDPAVRRYRAEAARARLGGYMTMTVWLGDSLTEGFSVTKRGFMWPLHLGRRLNGSRAMRAEYIPASTSALSWIGASFWPGGQSPWNYNNASEFIVGYGLDMHAVQINAGGYLELPYFGDIVNVVYARTPAAPAGGCPVTIDGVSVGTLSANGAVLPSQDAVYGTIGDYGAHTLRISVPSGALTVEGAVVFDGTVWGLGQAFGTIGVTAAGHGGFSATHFVDSGFPHWQAGVAARRPSLVAIELGANDAVQTPTPRTPAQFRGDLITIMNKIDTAVDAAGGTRPGYLLVQMPLAPASYVPAAWEACDAVDPERCAVLDLRNKLGSDEWGVLTADALAADGHPGNSGQAWIADAIAEAIDTSDSRAPTTPAEGVILEAITPATARSAWAESFTVVPDAAVPTTYDASPTGAVVGERRHRIWLDPGIYQARATLSRGNDRGQCQILVGHTSLGTADCYQSSADVNVFTLGSTITIQTPGWYPITIRKLATKNASSSEYAIRFHRLHLRKV